MRTAKAFECAHSEALECSPAAAHLLLRFFWALLLVDEPNPARFRLCVCALTCVLWRQFLEHEGGSAYHAARKLWNREKDREMNWEEKVQLFMSQQHVG